MADTTVTLSSASTALGGLGVGPAPYSASITLPLHTLSGAGLQSAAYFGNIELLGLTLSGSLEPPQPLPELTLSATGVAGLVGDGDLFLPAPTLSATMLVGGGATGDLTLPGLTLEGGTGNRADLTLSDFWITLSATGVAGSTGSAGMTSAGQIILPGVSLAGAMIGELLGEGDSQIAPLTLAAGGITGTASQGDLLLRAPSLSATLLTGTAPAGSVSLPEPTLSAVMVSGNTAVGAITLPTPQPAGVMPLAPLDGTGTGSLSLAAVTLAGTLLPGPLAVGALALRGLTVSGTLANSPVMTGDLVLAEFTLSAQSGPTANIAEAVVRIPAASLSAQAVSGNAATASIEIPLFTLDAATGAWDQSGSGAITLPLLFIGGEGATAIQTLPALTVVAIAVNTRTRAVTNYAGIAPNSLASFNGVTLLATADGIMALSGDTDGAAQIDAYLTSGKTDFGQRIVKRVLTGYVGYWASGELELTLITDDHHEHVYTLAPRQIDGESHASRAKFGHGVKGMYWQFKVSNVNGADFGLDRLELLTASTGMRT